MFSICYFLHSVQDVFSFEINENIVRIQTVIVFVKDNIPDNCVSYLTPFGINQVFKIDCPGLNPATAVCTSVFSLVKI